MQQHIRSLTGADLDALFEAVCLAFSDYVIPFGIARSQFDFMMRQRGLWLEGSLAAFDEERVTGFWLNAMPCRQRQHRAYTIMTGTIPPERGKGVMGRLLEKGRERLQEQGASGLQLEVICGNRTAERFYDRNGFRKQRQVVCYKMPALQVSAHAFDIRPITFDDVRAAGDFGDIAPTAQNDDVSLENVGDSCLLLGAYRDGALVGWIIAVKPSATIAQLAVDESSRRQGIGRTLVAEAFRATGAEALSLLNVDEGAAGFHAFLHALGGGETVRQNELILTF
ncbi:GNAT family N-acetyltransferase [Roseibium sp. RKSG952]|uniref:GNAT family N-acetyltransferase n=1 Tax=Roseibium sp. RKSG952 TaxID=2529384 RepID=UPI0012BC7708|nr:GNAT family N-acetyltransferase [Roseibium sp. RKSG952]MTH96864.1 GNAT family N-acetyltransferase [Roseibium sp. RKSG952]